MSVCVLWLFLAVLLVDLAAYPSNPAHEVTFSLNYVDLY